MIEPPLSPRFAPDIFSPRIKTTCTDICPVCGNAFGNGFVTYTRERMMVHVMCFVCSICKCELDRGSYGCDLNGKFFCPRHMKSAKPSEKDYRVLAKGYLRKQGNIVKKWRRRFFYLEVDSCEIRYYMDEDLSEYCGSIDLCAVSSVLPTYLTVPPDKNNPQLPSGSLPAIQLVTPGRVWNLACDTDSIRENWREAINQARAMSNLASPAASCGVGRSGDHSCSSPTVRTPYPEKPSLSSSSSSSSSQNLIQGSSPLPTSLSQPHLLSPLRSKIAPSLVQRPSSTTPAKPSLISEMSPSCFVCRERESDGDETVSPESSSTSRSRRESGLGRGDGSAEASQYMTTTTGSSVEAGALRSKISLPPILVPVSGFTSGNSTPASGNSAQFMSPVTPGKKPSSNALTSSEIVSPVPWQPSTPRNISGKSNSSNSVRAVPFLANSRHRAASAGASLSPQTPQLSVPNTLTSVTRMIPETPTEEEQEESEQQESLLCSPHEKLIVVCADSK